VAEAGRRAGDPGRRPAWPLHPDDDETSYFVLADDVIVTDLPLPVPPRLDDVVRIYAASQD